MQRSVGQGIPLKPAKLIGPTGHLLGIDQDDVARAAASERLAALPDDVRPEVDVLAGNFGELDSLLGVCPDPLYRCDSVRHRGFLGAD